MKILVIGNGFDLDHDLPTSYRDFINFCKCVMSIENNISASNINIENFELTSVQKEYICKLLENNSLLNRFKKLLHKNGLLNCFIEQQDKYNWVDLEKELYKIINEICLVELELKNSNQNKIQISQGHIINDLLRKLGTDILTDGELCIEGLEALRVSLINWLNDFSIALELYISEFINQTFVQGISPNILDFDADKIINFNYTNTYDRIYGGLRWNEDIHYIHGTAIGRLTQGNANIILGITSRKEDIYRGVNYAEFEKYYQRITKKTGVKYKSWLEQKDKEIEIAFFGHSLDSSDSDIINDLLYCPNAKITIYYHDLKSHKGIVANLIDILGKDELISFVSGKNPKLTFLKQKRHRINNTGGIEITRDIRNLYNLYDKSKREIDSLLNKIKQKIQDKDKNYLYTQKKAISLFEALEYNHINSHHVQDFFELCKDLGYEIKNDKLITYDDEEWADYTPLGMEPCSKKTSELISLFNNYNAEKFKKKSLDNPYIYITDLTSSDKIRDELLKIFSEENISTSYWKWLNELLELFGNNELLKQALRKIKAKNLDKISSIRFLHFYRAYEEHCYYIQEAEWQAKYQNDQNDFEELL